MHRAHLALAGLLLALLAAAPVRGAAPALRVLIDGYRLRLPPDQQPFIHSGRTLVPLRALSEALGFTVTWESAAQAVTLQQGDHRVQLTLGAATALVDGRSVPLDPPAQLVGDHTYVPLRLVSEGLGFGVDWDGTTHSVLVTTPKPPPVSSPPGPLRCRHCTGAPGEWGTPEDYPYFWQGGFWAPDSPDQLPPRAYGVLGPETHFLDLSARPAVRQYSLDAALPAAPPELAVYTVGSYPASHLALFNRTVAHPERWEYHPPYAEAQYVSLVPLGEPAPVRTPEQAAARAAELLGPLLLPDSRDNPTVVPEADGGWSVIFYRRLGRVRVYVDHPLTTYLNRDGQAVFPQGRRRPVLTASLYPLRTPQAAWELLQRGRWLQLYITNGAPPLRDVVDRFVVTSVELAYHEVQSTRPQQIMQPYYVFRNAAGQALYVPAVADPWVQWPETPAG